MMTWIARRLLLMLVPLVFAFLRTRWERRREARRA
jgi:hypothetical protein